MRVYRICGNNWSISSPAQPVAFEKEQAEPSKLFELSSSTERHAHAGERKKNGRGKRQAAAHLKVPRASWEVQ